jgi:hypothetical protein
MILSILFTLGLAHTAPHDNSPVEPPSGPVSQSSQMKCVNLVRVGLQKVPDLEACMTHGFVISQAVRTVQLFGGRPEKRVEAKQ